MEQKEETKAFHRIGEVAAMFGVNPSQLRFWEQELSRLKPMKTRKGDRLYAAKDLELIRQILYLTREKGMTLDGVRKHLDKPAVKQEVQESLLQRLRDLRSALIQLKEELNES